MTVAAIALMLVLSGCASQPFVVKSNVNYTGRGANDVYVVDHGWHTGFAVPAHAIEESLPELKSRFPEASYIEFGWGDKGFYQAKQITTGLTVRAIFWPTDTVIHAVAVPGNVYEYFPYSKIQRLCVTDDELSSLVRFISESFYRDKNGNVLKLRNGIYGDSQFYKAVGNYYLMNTCNKWTAKGLRNIGLDISPMFKLTAGSVMSSLDGIDSVPARSSGSDRRRPRLSCAAR